MKFINQIGPKTVRLAFMVAFLNVASCGGDKKRFCNCAFDCLTEEGIEYHNVTLSGESAYNLDLGHVWPDKLQPTNNYAGDHLVRVTRSKTSTCTNQ